MMNIRPEIINGQVMENMILSLFELKIIDQPISCEYYGYDTISRCKFGRKNFHKKGI